MEMDARRNPVRRARWGKRGRSDMGKRGVFNIEHPTSNIEHPRARIEWLSVDAQR